MDLWLHTAARFQADESHNARSLCMNVQALQRADRWLGVPLCFGLTWVDMLAPRRRGSVAPRRILFVKLAEQGSTVLAYPALRRAVEIAGRENVFCLVFEDNRFILDLLGVIPAENVVTVRTRGPVSLARTTWAAIRRLRRLDLDAAIDLEFFSRGSAALAWLSGAAARVGFHAWFGAGPYRGNLMTHRLLYNPHLHTTETFLSLVEAVLHPPRTLPTYDFVPRVDAMALPRFEPGAEELERVRVLIRRETGGEQPLILLNPNAGDLLPLRRWPPGRYVELAKQVLARHEEACIGFTGSPNEAPATEPLVRAVASPRCVSFAGKTTLRELLVLYTQARVLVTNDSGPAHFAALTPIRVVTLFGPETPALFGARTPRNTVLSAGLACSPCLSALNNRRSPCRNNRCMQAISVEQVLTLVRCLYEQSVPESSPISA